MVVIFIYLFYCGFSITLVVCGCWWTSGGGYSLENKSIFIYFRQMKIDERSKQSTFLAFILFSDTDFCFWCFWCFFCFDVFIPTNIFDASEECVLVFFFCQPHTELLLSLQFYFVFHHFFIFNLWWGCARFIYTISIIQFINCKVLKKMPPSYL